ncbi:hypothetical protein [Fictibacillus terranigra]|uniref:Uncharacterized protein n=1 Tax=Fictibacillus terranigra TaxID=3058424 RepID=A0ABT8E4I4_9BACL|nr:hypothetical protein [Fictibacillus sp. CENA-BCM004]MDN4072809.1 hypothetical protein [Fictibacillus sp. CENA-BCM004]
MMNPKHDTHGRKRILASNLQEGQDKITSENSGPSASADFVEDETSQMLTSKNNR